MAVLWNKHRFSGGALILDVTNTVVLRGDLIRSFDRFADSEEIPRFAEAASNFRSQELAGRRLVFEVTHRAVATVIGMRERADGLFRDAVLRRGVDSALLSQFLHSAGRSLGGVRERIGLPGEPFGDPSGPLRLEVALAVSALSLLAPHQLRKLRICPNCNWLFIDRSRNSSRLWCDMSVCGNRQKARRHYQRRKVEEVANA